MTIQAIETRYAGCRFRSRLEARWAVFFDHLGIRWEYEPQGFHLTHRLTLEPVTFTYLPDFFLPELQLWAEVKGSLPDEETIRLANAAASLSSNDGGGCRDQGGHDVIVLGLIPDDRSQRVPVRLHLHKGDLHASPWRLEADGCGAAELGALACAADVGSSDPFREWGITASMAGSMFLNGIHDPHGAALLRGAVRVARSARFEHGERG